MKKLLLVAAALLMTACGGIKCNTPEVVGVLEDLSDNQMVYMLDILGVPNSEEVRNADKDFKAFFTEFNSGEKLECKCSVTYNIDDVSEEFILDYKVTMADDGQQFLVTLVNME